jgi:DNA-directed RNA polymerase II subunit RPB2
MRRKNEIPKEYSIVRDVDKREIKIYTDGGRCQRAMFIVEGNEILLKKKHVRNLIDVKESTDTIHGVEKVWDFE